MAALTPHAKWVAALEPYIAAEVKRGQFGDEFIVGSALIHVEQTVTPPPSPADLRPVTVLAYDILYRARGRQYTNGAATPASADDILAEMRALRVVVSQTKPNPQRADQWLVGDLIRPGALIVLASQEGVGKSYIGSEIALRGAIGTGALFDYPPYAIRRAFKVALLDDENGEDEEADREEAALAGLGTARGDLGERYVRYSFAFADLVSADGRARIEAVIALDQPDLLVLDTATGMVGEEWGTELKFALRWLRALADANALAVLLLVHLVKPQRDRSGTRQTTNRSLSDVMGQWSRPVDGVIVLSGASGEDRIHFDVYKRIPKARLVLAQSNGLWTVVGTGLEPLRVTLPPGAGATGEAILRAIDDDLDVISEKVLKVSHSGFHAAMKALREAGLVAPGLPYTLTPAGLQAVHPQSSESPPEMEVPTLDL